MKDPREYDNHSKWLDSFKLSSENNCRSGPRYCSERRAYIDICARLNAKDDEIAALKASIVELDHKYAKALSDLVAQWQEGE